MSAVGGAGAGGNYISAGDIEAWLAQEQDRIYGDLSKSIDLSNSRAQFTDKLNDIKADLTAANKSHDFSKVDGELQDFMSKYGSDPAFQDLASGLKDMADKIHSDYQARKDYPQDLKDFYTAEQKYEAAALRVSVGVGSDDDKKILANGQPSAPTKLPDQAYDDGTISGWNDLISGKTDVLNKNDQLTMIHIQELKATADQGAQLGSQFISSGDKTTSSIINNIA